MHLPVVTASLVPMQAVRHHRFKYHKGLAGYSWGWILRQLHWLCLHGSWLQAVVQRVSGVVGRSGPLVPLLCLAAEQSSRFLRK